MPVLYRRGLLETTRVTMLSPEVISPNPDQPRRYFDPDGLRELAESIRVHGILQPLSVRRKGGGRYELIAGERRLRAAILCGLEQVPARHFPIPDRDDVVVYIPTTPEYMETVTVETFGVTYPDPVIIGHEEIPDFGDRA